MDVKKYPAMQTRCFYLPKALKEILKCRTDELASPVPFYESPSKYFSCPEFLKQACY